MPKSVRPRGPFDPAATADYVRHRLEHDSCDVETFDPQALAAVHDHSGGVPRRIDRLCEMAILVASQSGSRTVTVRDIQLVAAERCLLDGGLP